MNGEEVKHHSRIIVDYLLDLRIDYFPVLVVAAQIVCNRDVTEVVNRVAFENYGIGDVGRNVGKGTTIGVEEKAVIITVLLNHGVVL